VKRSAMREQRVRSSSGRVVRATREGHQRPRSPATGRAAVVMIAGVAGLAELREGWKPEGSRRWAFDSGSMRSTTARPRAAGTRPSRSLRQAEPITVASPEPPKKPDTQRRRPLPLPPERTPRMAEMCASPLRGLGV
jgi:hypothetical protein